MSTPLSEKKASSPLESLLPPRQKKELSQRERYKRNSLIAAIVGGIIFGFIAICVANIFPMELIGGPVGAGLLFVLALQVLGVALPVLLHTWYPFEETPQEDPLKENLQQTNA